MKEKLSNWMQDKFLSAFAIFIIAQFMMLIAKIIDYSLLAWRYTLIPLWLFMLYFTILFILSSSEEKEE